MSEVSDDFVIDLLFRQRRWYMRMIVFLPCVVLLPMLIFVVVCVKWYVMETGYGADLIQWGLSIALLPLGITSLVSVFVVTKCPPSLENESLEYMRTARAVALAWWLGVFALLGSWELYVILVSGDFFEESAAWMINLQRMLLISGAAITGILSVPMLLVTMTYWSELADYLKAEHRYSRSLLNLLLVIALAISFLSICLVFLMYGSLIFAFMVWFFIFIALMIMVIFVMILIGAAVTWHGACRCWKKSLSEIEQWGIMQEKQNMEAADEMRDLKG